MSTGKTQTPPQDFPTWMYVVTAMAGFFRLYLGVCGCVYFSLIFKNIHKAVVVNPLLLAALIFTLYNLIMGFVYLLASTNLTKHWPVIDLGTLLQIIGVFGIVVGETTGQTELLWPGYGLAIDLIWLPTFLMILWQAFYLKQAGEVRI